MSNKMIDHYDTDSTYDFKNVQNDQQERGAANNDLDFNSFYQRKFEQSNAGNPMLVHSGNEKQLFTNMIVNIFVPVDPTLINSQFNLNDTLDDEPEKLERLQYFCEVPDYTTAEVLLLKSIDNFNSQLSQKNSAIQLVNDLSKFSLRIGKKKNGKPNSDYPKVDLSQNIVDVDFTNFCVVYTWEGVVNQLITSTQSNLLRVQKGGITKNESSAYEKMSLMNSSYNQTLATEAADSRQTQKGILANQHQNQQACCNCNIF
ncbi:UNKNOWN [Stylonychia lemnae]|uniref:Uncharacterized protein n=1 Tax=Stylonychia lemnae TaxID=5949 RepID=A0A078AE80_STYLE|nr:UNKNOWN [Stylonychia lemnae]|eukprot:CDW80141.1 UNKNOWN [Stylonychia lemnae]